jgi:UDP-N-acetylmuramyl pentapeptide phosphotransferase/UDP-N-acetylglucosamine-1-phosphate transferase
MENFLHNIPQPLKGFIFSLILSVLLMPLIIRIIRRGNWVDKPDGRKVHKKPIPTMGGIVIFLSMFIVSIARPAIMTMDMVIVLGCSLILFFTGIIDDLKAVRPRTKFYVQIIASLIVIFYGIRIDSLEAIGLGNLGWILSVLFTTLCIVFFINAFNLIDGIDGLAGGLSIISLSAFSVLFYICGQMDYAFLAAALAGSCLGFLFFNFNPARIFMGDTGSLTIGFFLAVFSIEAIKLPQLVQVNSIVIDTFSVTFALVLLPSLDAARVILLSSPIKHIYIICYWM